MGWLEQHLREFVKPVLGEVPELQKDCPRLFSPQEMAVVKGMWRSVKRSAKDVNKPILLAGRDVWMFEVLARREGFPTTFRPEISRRTVQHIQEDYTKHFLFDTGFLGSIPRALKCEAFTMGSAVITAGRALRGAPRHSLYTTETHQVFPRMKGARSLILKIERTPKYWKRGFYRAPETIFCNCDVPNRHAWLSSCLNCGAVISGDCRTGILQDLADLEQFKQATMLTIQIYKDNSPGFINSPVEVLSHTTGLIGYD